MAPPGVVSAAPDAVIPPDPQPAGRAGGPDELPLPPLHLRELVGLTDLSWYDNQGGDPIFPGADIPEEAYRSYLDFGCGCGRSARRLIQQRARPQRYVGVDLHRGMVQWCQHNLAPRADGFSFVHHDVYSPCLNPDPLRPWALPLPVEDGSVTLMEATSVFTHLIEGQAEFYLDEVSRVLAPDGRLLATWFLFEKESFPYLQDNQNALYVNDRDPTNAVAYDRAWLLRALRERGLVIASARPPAIRGFHWVIGVARAGTGINATPLPPDDAPVGRQPPPRLRPDASRFGTGEVEESDACADLPPEPARAEVPPPSHLAVELDGARRYIASLEQEVQRLTAALAGTAGGAGPEAVAGGGTTAP